MMSFKTFLKEAYSTVKAFDATKLTLDDVIQAYINGGYGVDSNDRKLYKSATYRGYSSGHHIYYVVLEDDNDDTGYYISAFHLAIGAEGMITAEPGGNSVEDGFETATEALDRVQKLIK